MTRTLDDSVVAFIFARGGSKGVPRKNIREMAGKPLIGWSIEHAKSVSRIKRVLVSTDDPEIASIARSFGAEIPFLRPPELARDESPEWMAWQHALEFLRQESGHLPMAMVSVPTTAPLRCPGDIEKCLDMFEGGSFDIVLTVSEARRNPYFNMVTRSTEGVVSVCIKNGDTPNRRQDTPEIFDVTTVAYVCDPLFVLNRRSIFDGRVGAVVVPADRAIDIDTITDFEVAEFLLRRKLK